MKKIAVLLANGFEEVEALLTVDILRRANFQCDTVSIHKNIVESSHGVILKADICISDDIKNYDMLVLPGGMPGAKHLKENQKVIELVRYFNENNKFVAAICAAPMVLHAAGITDGKKVTSYPDDDYRHLFEKDNYSDDLVVIDNHIITSRGPATTFEFAYTLVDVLGGDSGQLKEAMVYNQFVDTIKKR